MPATEEREIRRNRGGMIVVVVLAIIFFLLIVLIMRGVKRGSDAGEAHAQPGAVYVVAEKLRVRAEPSAKAEVVAQVTQGEELQLLEAQGPWIHVKTRSGKEGWAERSAVEDAQERERRVARVKSIRSLPSLDGVALEETALYAGPGLFYSVIGQLKPKARVRVFTRDHDFYAIDFGGAVAYASVDAVDLAVGGGDTAVEVASTEEKGTTTATSTEAPEETAAVTPTETEEPEERPAASAVYSTVPQGGTEPVVASRAMPSYPAAARARGTEGTVILRVIVRKDGSVDDVNVLRDQPNGLGDAAAEAVRNWRFRPATYQGQPIDVYYTVTVNFRLSA